MADWTPTPGLHSNVDEALYHSHRDSLSVSGAKVLLKSPKKFRWQQDNPVHKDVFDFGTAAHALVLGVGAPIHVVYADSWRGKDAQAEKTHARENGHTPLLDKDYQRVQAMADELSSHTLAMQLLTTGEPEVSGYAVDDDTGVLRRGRFDWLHPSLLVDYKSAASSHPDDLAGRYGAINKWGYAQQAAWYLDLARDCGHPAEGFALVLQEKEPPFEATVAFIDEDDLHVARERNRRALEIFRDCRESGIWPGAVPDNCAVRVSLEGPIYEQEVIL